jgi:cytochrome c553
MKFAFITTLVFCCVGLANAADIQKGQALVEKGACTTCHGAGLNAPILPVYPRLAGQPADYLYYALHAYQVGGSNAKYGRNNAIMAGQVQPYSDQDLKDIAAYVSSLPGTLVIKK